MVIINAIHERCKGKSAGGVEEEKEEFRDNTAIIRVCIYIIHSYCRSHDLLQLNFAAAESPRELTHVCRAQNPPKIL